jgi:hypothetical protein
VQREDHLGSVEPLGIDEQVNVADPILEPPATTPRETRYRSPDQLAQ